jgi:hypothetical protein
MVVVGGVEHTLRGPRARRYLDILARKYQEQPELLFAGRLARANAEQVAFLESEQSTPNT